MTDLDISKALALAIGWKRVEIVGGSVIVYTGNSLDKVFYNKNGNWVWNHRVFDYRDWNVIGPIAEKYDCFPYMNSAGNWVVGYRRFLSVCHTPQEAISQAVIEEAKKCS